MPHHIGIVACSAEGASLCYQTICVEGSQYLGEHAHSEACDVLSLGCTEIPLIMNNANSPLPVLDSTRLLARAALQRAIQR